jgi:hypothetical protein
MTQRTLPALAIRGGDWAERERVEQVCQTLLCLHATASTSLCLGTYNLEKERGTHSVFGDVSLQRLFFQSLPFFFPTSHFSPELGRSLAQRRTTVQIRVIHRYPPRMRYDLPATTYKEILD